MLDRILRRSILGGRRLTLLFTGRQFDSVLVQMLLRWRRSLCRPTGRRRYIIDLLLPPAIQEDVQENLAELMEGWTSGLGERRARKVRRRQVMRIVQGHHRSRLAKVFGRVVKFFFGR